MPIMSKPPEWHNPGSEPPENKKVTGWEVDERPPAGWFNWLFHRIYRSLLELSAAIAGHRDNKDNPHSVTPSQIGAETPAGAQAKIDVHEAKAAPHSGHATTTSLNNHVNDKNNPHGVTPSQIGAETPAGAQAKVAAHAGTGGSAHAIATQGVAGFMSPADKAKLDGLNASDYAEAVAEVEGKRAGYAVYAP